MHGTGNCRKYKKRTTNVNTEDLQWMAFIDLCIVRLTAQAELNKQKVVSHAEQLALDLELWGHLPVMA